MATRRLPIVLAVALAIAVGVIFWQWERSRDRHAPEPGRAASRETRYHCPMHPTMISDVPGDCPICGMRMVAIEAGEPVPEGAPAGRAADGYARVQIPPEKQRRIGVRTAPARRMPFVRTLHAVGRVVADETRLHHVHTKIEGWIERLHVNTTGERVERGRPLLTIYSPELVATQEEYLLLLRSRDAAAAEGAVPQVSRSTEGLIESARRRLLLFDLPPAQIEALETSRVPSRTVTLFAPISGYVTQRNVTQGEKIDPGITLLDIADLSRVWVIASIYEYELPFVSAGQAATVRLSYLPGRAFRGRVTLVYPVLEGATRTVQVRLEFANADLALKPEMYADVGIESDLGVRLGVPETAVLASGTRNIVFVERGGGTFEPREVKLGLRLPDAVEVLDGVAEGEEVVTAGTFFIDSESKLKAALAGTAETPAAREHAH